METWHGLVVLVVVVGTDAVDLLKDAYQVVRDKGLGGGGTTTMVVLGVVGAVLLWVGSMVLAWWTRRYALDADAVYYRSGVLLRRLRVARLPRIQSVDVVHPLLGRILGLGRLTIEVAGGRDSHVVIGYLRSNDLQNLRSEILRLASGAAAPDGPAGPGGSVASGGSTSTGTSTGTGAPTSAGTPIGTGASTGAETSSNTGASTSAGGPGTPSAPLGFESALAAPMARPTQASELEEHPLYQVETRVLMGSLVRDGGVLTGLVLVLVLLVGVAIVLARNGVDVIGNSLSQVVILLTAVSGYLGYAWSRLRTGWGFRAAATPAGIRLRFGLTDEVCVTIPPGRVHAVELRQNLLWRGRDWWTVKVALAGREADDHDDVRSQADRLLPVGHRGDALRALWLVVPDLGVQDPRALLASALSGRGRPDDAPEPGWDARTVRRARWLSPLGWRCEAVAVTRTCVILRRGRWRRVVTVLPYERVQSLRVTQGPVARWWRVAGLRLDTVAVVGAGRCVATSLEAAQVARLAQVISEHARRRQHDEQLDRWLARATEPVPWHA